MHTQDAQAREALITYFAGNGLLLCNENPALPYLDFVGGNWNAIVSLMESGDVFHSRLFHHRVTYLSRALYFAIKPYRQRIQRLDAASIRLLEFLRAAGEANAEEMQVACCMEKQTQTKALEQLVEEMFVTVSRRDKTIHENWCTFCYCPAECWEEKGFIPSQQEMDRALNQLRNHFTEKQIQNLFQERISLH